MPQEYQNPNEIAADLRVAKNGAEGGGMLDAAAKVPGLGGAVDAVSALRQGRLGAAVVDAAAAIAAPVIGKKVLDAAEYVGISRGVIAAILLFFLFFLLYVILGVGYAFNHRFEIGWEIIKEKAVETTTK